MNLFLIVFLACFPEIREGEERRFVDNPRHDFDGDGLLDEADCDDSNDEITLPINYYLDADGDGFGVESDSMLSCPADKPDGYVEEKIRNGVVRFDCNDNSIYAHPDGIERCDLLDNDCNDIVDDYDGPDAPVWYVDSDGDGFGDIRYPERRCTDADGNGPDGYVINSGDCDDGHADSHPFVDGLSGGVEVCDDEGRDENCDGLVNDANASDALIWYRDADGDSYGNLLINQRSCTQPTGFVLDNTDCNDANVSSNPGHVELCDIIDNDCDGAVDEPDSIDAVDYFLDTDGDGYGNPTEVLVVCPMYQPSTYVEDNTDCDDLDATQNPSVLERCSGEDDDCDGSIDEDNGSNPPVGSPTWYEDSDGDLFGDELVSLVQCSQPLNYVEAVGDCDDSDMLINPDAVEMCTLDIDENCDGDATYGVPTQDLLEWYPDSDGDGYGNPSFVIRLCEQPQNYVSNSDDCDDTDEWVHPENDFLHIDDGTIDSGQGLCNGCTYVDHQELCNGKVDLCENDLLGDLTPLAEEVDDDGDGYVECDLDVEAVLWENPIESIVGGNDCDDTSDYRHPNAAERCNGIYDDCNTLFVNGGFPPDEVDDDLDCFVECTDFDPIEWEGGGHSCSYRDLNGVMQSATSVIGGEDCNDSVEYTYVGAAPQTDPNACLTDFDGDGLSDRSWDLCSETQNFDDARFRLEGTHQSNAKVYARGIGDFDGDGENDLLISSGQGLQENSYHRLYPNVSFDDASPVLTESDYLWSEEAYYTDSANRFPYAVIDDLDGDGIDEYAYGYRFGGGTFNGLYRPGYVGLYLSTTFANHGSRSTSANQDLQWVGQNDGAFLQGVYGIGDVDQDGLGEVLLVAGGATENFVTVGKAYLYYGSTLNTMSGLVDLSTADKVFMGSSILVLSHAANLDVDGDSIKDIVVVYGGYYATSNYDNFVAIYLGANLASKPRELTVADADLGIYGTTEHVNIGRFIGNAGDVDGDGSEDLLIAEYPNIYKLPNFNLVLSASLDLSNPYQDLGSVTSLIFSGHNDDLWDTYDTHYAFVKGLGDLDGDGLSDIGINWYKEHVDDRWDTAVFMGSSIQSLLNDQNDTGLDTGQTSEPLTIQFTDGDLHFEDVQSGLAGGDFDGDGLGEIVLSNYMANHSVLGGGVIGVFSACEN